MQQKSARLAILNIQLDIDGGHGRDAGEQAIAKSARPSVLDKLNRPVPPRDKAEKPKRRDQER